MSKYIDADLYVEMEVYDDEHEDWCIWSGTIEDLLDQYTERGCPPTIEVSEDNEPTWEQVKEYCFKRNFAIVGREIPKEYMRESGYAEVSEDCISREWLLSKVYDMDNDYLVVDLKDIEDAPSVILLQDDVVMERLDFVKKAIETHIDDALCGIYFTRNWVGDRMVYLDRQFGIDIEICYEYAYFEIFGLTDYEQKVIESFYDGLSAAKRNK